MLTLSKLIVVPKNPTIAHKEQAINHVIMLKHFVNAILPVCEALAGAASELLKQVLDVRCKSNENSSSQR